MNDPCVEGKARMTQISERLENLFRVAEALDNTISRAEESLVPVLRPSNPTPGEGVCKKLAEEPVPLAQTLDQLAGRFASAVGRMDGILDRLEL